MVPCCEFELNQTGSTGNLPVGLGSSYSVPHSLFLCFMIGLQGLGLATCPVLFALQLNAVDRAGWSDLQAAASVSVYITDV